MMAKLYNDKYTIITEGYIPRNEALRLGYKDLIERKIPSDYTEELYDIVYRDDGQWIIKLYMRKHGN